MVRPTSGRKKIERPEGEGVTIDLGFGSIFKGIGSFIDLLSGMLEEGKSEVSRSGEIKFKGADRLRGVYGFTVRSGIGGIPQVERFGNIRETVEGPVVSETREPLVDVLDEDKAVLIVAELPGVTEKDIQVEVKDDVLSVSTSGEREYAKEVLLPAIVDPTTMRKSYKNGVLEIRLEKAQQ